MLGDNMKWGKFVSMLLVLVMLSSAVMPAMAAGNEEALLAVCPCLNCCCWIGYSPCCDAAGANCG